MWVSTQKSAETLAEIATLRRERDLIQDEARRLRDQVQILQENNTTLQKSLVALATEPAKPPQPGTKPKYIPPTSEEIAARLGVPVHLVKQIDFERMGQQLQEV